MFVTYLLVAALLASTLILLGPLSRPEPIDLHPLAMPVVIVFWPLWGLFLIFRWGERKWKARSRD